MWPFGRDSDDPAASAEETTTAQLTPEGSLRLPAGPDWLTGAPYAQIDAAGEGLVALTPTHGGVGEGSVERVDSVDGAAAVPVAPALQEEGIAPETLPEPVRVEVACDPDGERLLLDAGRLADALVSGIDAGDEVVSACPRP